MSNAIKILMPVILSFLSGILLTPVLTHYFYKYKLWRRVSRLETGTQPAFHAIHDSESEVRTPRVGGMIIWMSVIFTLFFIWLLGLIFGQQVSENLNFISRRETVLPFFTLIVASLIGLGDDFIQIFATGRLSNDPIRLRWIKIGIILSLGIIIGWWFYVKLGIDYVFIPGFGFFTLGFLFLPFFIIIMLAVFSSSVIDGLDGLSGGVLASIFAGYAVITFAHAQYDLSAFCAVITSGILAFLWFNIPPARFYMGETGMIGLTVTISVIAFLTNTVLLLPIIAFPLFITSLTSIIQMLSRKFRNGKKVFLVAPLHHHLEALGWPKYKVTMRYWVVSIITTSAGVIIALLQ
jgi:phospho-N-acetylmuramoyl-pentapeptide-transferase